MLDQDNSLPVDENNLASEDKNTTLQDSESVENENKEKEEPLKKLEAGPETKLLENKAVEEIENKIAETSEAIVHSPVEMLDYESLNLEELVNQFEGPENIYFAGMPLTRANITTQMRRDMSIFLPVGLALMILFFIHTPP